MSMQSLMARDLREVFRLDMPAQCKIGGVVYVVLLNDTVNDELDTYGGPERIEMQNVHFQTSHRAEIDDGTTLQVRRTETAPWVAKIVMSSVTSADGNELIVTVKGS